MLSQAPCSGCGRGALAEHAQSTIREDALAGDRSTPFVREDALSTAGAPGHHRLRLLQDGRRRRRRPNRLVGRLRARAAPRYPPCRVGLRFSCAVNQNPSPRYALCRRRIRSEARAVLQGLSGP